jgi:uncharacterized membrane protein
MSQSLLSKFGVVPVRTAWKCAILALSVMVAGALFWHNPVKASAGSVTQYKFVSLNFPGAASTEAHGINERGDVVGRYWDGQKNQGFLMTEDGFRTIDFGSEDTALYGINGREEMVGIRFDFTAPPFGHGFSFFQGKFSGIYFPGSDITLPYAVNDSGEIVGSYELGPPNFTSRGFIKSEGVYKALDFPGAAYSYPTGVSNTGAIVGIAVLNPTRNPCCSGYLYKDGVFSRIDFPGAGTTATYAYGVNRQETITGWYSDANFNAHGFVKTAGQFTTVDYPGSTSTLIQALNDRGYLVGYYSGGDCAAQAGNTCGFIATPMLE